MGDAMAEQRHLVGIFASQQNDPGFLDEVDGFVHVKGHATDVASIRFGCDRQPLSTDDPPDAFANSDGGFSARLAGGSNAATLLLPLADLFDSAPHNAGNAILHQSM